MSVNGRKFLEPARLLASQRAGGQTAEALHRSAVSRAYYAAFHLARRYAEANQTFVSQRSADDHARLAAHFRDRPDENSREIATMLTRLRQRRRLADYD